MKTNKIHLLVALIIFGFMTTSGYNASAQAEENPDPVFSLTYLSPTGNSAREAYSLLLVETFPKAGIGITKHEITDFTTMSKRAWAWDGGYPIPLFDGGGFDVLSVGLSGGFAYDPTGTFHTSAHNPNGLNMYDYGNATTDAMIEAFATEQDFAKRDVAAKVFQKQLLFDMPVLTIYYTVNLQVARTDLGWDATDVLWKVQGNDGLLWANISGGANNEFSWAHPYGLNELDPITATQYMSVVTQLPLFPGLYNRDPTSTPLGQWKPALAAAPIEYSTDGKNATVKLRTDAKFSNGDPLMAQDVKNTWEWAMSDATGTKIKGNFIDYIAHNDSVIVVDDHTVKFVFEEKYFDPESILNAVPIMPLSVLGPVTAPKIANYDFTPCALTCVVGTGPFQYEAIDTVAKEIKLKAVPNWWGGDVEADTIYFPFYADKAAAQVAIKAGEVDYIDNNYVSQEAEVAGAAGVTAFKGIMDGGTQMVSLNLNHPVYGTGVDTPLGKDDPSRAAEAARYVRYAMNSMVPRDLIVADILKGLGVAAVSNWPMLSPHFDTTQTVTPFSVEKAQEWLELAGYDFSSGGDDGFLPISDYLPIAFGVFVTSAIIVKRKR
jgi:ABC-type transport system substrate-binding protein